LNQESKRSAAHGTFGQRIGRTGYVTPTLIALLCAGLLIAPYEQGRGKYVRLRNAVITQPPASGPATGPGGPAPVLLTRAQASHGTAPEFLSATFLPGRGFNLWQLTAYLPGHGEVSLLVAPPVEKATELLSGNGPDTNGSAAATAGGAFLAPWAGQLTGAPSAAGLLQTTWVNSPLFFPAQPPGSNTSTEGLLLKQVADSANTSALSDGQAAEAVYHAQSFGNQWPSSTDVTIEASLSGSTLELTMTAHNIGSAAEPIGLGWLPYFAIPSGRRAAALLTIPASQRSPAAAGHSGLPSGRILSVSETPFDLQYAGGTRLGALDLDETYLDLHSAILADGPIAELRDPAFGYGLRVIPLSANVTNLRVIAPANKPWVSIGPNTNVPDPFGQEWQGLDSNGVLTLQPGASVQWKVRIELFSTTGTAPSAGSGSSL